MKTFKEMIYFNREKEENWDIMDKAKRLEFKGDIKNLSYLGYGIEMEVEISEDCKSKILSVNGVDISDKEIYI